MAKVGLTGYTGLDFQCSLLPVIDFIFLTSYKHRNVFFPFMHCLESETWGGLAGSRDDVFRVRAFHLDTTNQCTNVPYDISVQH